VNAVTGTVSRTFRSLRVRNYRWYFFAQMISMSGTWMQSLAQGWLVLDLTHHSALMLSVTVALQFGPVLVIGPWGGLIADRTDKRKLLIATQSVMAVLALTLGVLTLTGSVRVWMVMVLAALMGVTNGIDNPARQSFVIEMVGADDVVNAVALNSVIVNASRVIGPAVAGVLILTIGLGWCFLLNAASFVFVIAALAAMRTHELRQARPVARKGGQLRAGFAYIRRTPELSVPLLMMAVVGTLGYNFSVVLPLMARVAFHRGAGSYSSLMTAMGVGALAGGLYAAARARPSRRLLVASTVLFGIVTIVAAAMPNLAWELVLLVLLGATSVLFISTTNSLLQLNSEPSMRGRVMSLWAVVFLGSTPIGALVVGTIAAAYGPRAAFAFGGVASLLTGVVAWWALRRRRERERLAAAGELGGMCLPDTPEPDDTLQADPNARAGSGPGRRRENIPGGAPGRPTM
jgi:MFS family permease